MIRLCLSLIGAWCLCFGSPAQVVEEWRRALPQRSDSSLAIYGTNADSKGLLYAGDWSRVPLLHVSGFDSAGTPMWAWNLTGDFDPALTSIWGIDCTVDGNILLAGTLHLQNGDTGLIGRLNGSNGQAEWLDHLAQPEWLGSQFHFAASLPDDTSIFVGSRSLGAALRYSATGERLWLGVIPRPQGVSLNPFLNAVVGDDGAVTIAASRYRGFERSVGISRILANGAIAWDWQEAFANGEVLVNFRNNLTVDRTGAAIVLGDYHDYVDENERYSFLIRLDENGSFEWKRRLDVHGYFGSPGQGMALADALYLRGWTDFDYYNKRPLLAKADATTGEMIWIRRLEPPAPNEPYYFNLLPYIDHRGDIYVVGATHRFEGPPEEEIRTHHRWMIYKYHPDGTLVWRHWLAEVQIEGPYRVNLDGQDCMYAMPSYTRGDLRHVIKFRFFPVRREGDLNGDGCVDDKDLAAMLELYGTNDPAGDANEDGIVDDADLSIAFKYFGYGCR